MKSLLILGYGYLGFHFEKYLKAQNLSTDIFRTKRTQDIIFDIQEKETWKNIPDVENTLWTFPAKPIELISEFYEQMHSRLGKIVCIGSTLALVPKMPGFPVDEMTPLSDHDERVHGEKFLQAKGATMVRSAGIYGPDRDPRRWLKEGRIKNFDRPINFIHVEDLCQFAYKAFSEPYNSKAFLACDSKTYLWNELIEHWRLREQIPTIESVERRKTSKIVVAKKSREDLGIDLKYPDVISGVEVLK
jgi:nucleoside-diphosphate-sugar epimerase